LRRPDAELLISRVSSNEGGVALASRTDHRGLADDVKQALRELAL
jgi:hypothetical protein